MTAIHVVGTADTKGEELAYIRGLVAAGGCEPVVVNIGTRPTKVPVDVTAEDIAAFHPDGPQSVLGGDDRGQAVACMGAAFSRWCEENARRIAGMIAIGGGGGTSMATAGMRKLGYGIPKFMVSTLASGDTAPYIGTSDIVMVPSITDIAGLNRISRVVLANATNALIGAVNASRPDVDAALPAIGVTMFGVTTDCVNQLTGLIRDRFDCLVFHATGTGGQTMEKLLEQGLLEGAIDITTTEIADLLFGGVLAAKPDRLDVFAASGKPWLGSVGALDMVNFWAPETVPERYAGRTFYHHNPNVTLMRTTSDENAEMGRWIGKKLNRFGDRMRLLVPEKGISALDIAGGPFWDRDADAALFESLRDTVEDPDRLMFLPCHINDRAFAQAAADQFLDLMEA